MWTKAAKIRRAKSRRAERARNINVIRRFVEANPKATEPDIAHYLGYDNKTVKKACFYLNDTNHWYRDTNEHELAIWDKERSATKKVSKKTKKQMTQSAA